MSFPLRTVQNTAHPAEVILFFLCSIHLKGCIFTLPQSSIPTLALFVALFVPTCSQYIPFFAGMLMLKDLANPYPCGTKIPAKLF